MAKNKVMLKGIIAMGLFINWVNLLPFYGPQLTMLEITSNNLPHFFTALHIFGLVYGSLKCQGDPEDFLFNKASRISPYILSGLTISILIPSTSDSSFIILIIFTGMGLFSGLSVSRWLAWFSSDTTKNKRIQIFGRTIAATYILMSIITITSNWAFNSLVLGLLLSSITVLAGGLLINELNIPFAKNISININAIIPPPALILFALFAYSSISLFYDQIFDWGMQLSALPILLTFPYVFVGFFLTRWVSSQNRIYFAIIAFFLVGLGFLSYLFDSSGSLSAIIGILITTGLLCIHLYYWTALVDNQNPYYAPIPISIGVSFELAVFAAIYSITPYLNLDLNRPGLLTGIAGLIFVLLGFVIITLNAHKVDTKLTNRSVYGIRPDHISPLIESNPKVSTMSAFLNFHNINPKFIEGLLKDEFSLTDREVEVAYLLFLGYKNKEIQNNLCITMNTLKYHVRNVYLKLGVNNRDKAFDLVFAMITKYKQGKEIEDEVAPV